MARLPRPDVAGIAQHVVQRGNDRLPCFYDDDDRRRYLTALQHVAQRYACLIRAYVLMTNHVHLLATPSAAGAISRMMQTLGRLYVADFNARHRRGSRHRLRIGATHAFRLRPPRALRFTTGKTGAPP